jgi:hypothetical protein
MLSQPIYVTKTNQYQFEDESTSSKSTLVTASASELVYRDKQYNQYQKSI